MADPINLGDVLTGDCRPIANIPFGPVKADAEGKLAQLEGTDTLPDFCDHPAICEDELFPGEPTDGTGQTYKDKYVNYLASQGIFVCDDAEHEFAKKWTPLVLWLGGCDIEVEDSLVVAEIFPFAAQLQVAGIANRAVMVTNNCQVSVVYCKGPSSPSLTEPFIFHAYLARSGDGQNWSELEISTDILDVIGFPSIPDPPRLGGIGSQAQIAEADDGILHVVFSYNLQERLTGQVTDQIIHATIDGSNVTLENLTNDEVRQRSRTRPCVDVDSENNLYIAWLHDSAGSGATGQVLNIFYRKNIIIPVDLTGNESELVGYGPPAMQADGIDEIRIAYVKTQLGPDDLLYRHGLGEAEELVDGGVNANRPLSLCVELDILDDEREQEDKTGGISHIAYVIGNDVHYRRRDPDTEMWLNEHVFAGVGASFLSLSIDSTHTLWLALSRVSATPDALELYRKLDGAADDEWELVRTINPHSVDETPNFGVSLAYSYHRPSIRKFEGHAMASAEDTAPPFTGDMAEVHAYLGFKKGD